MTEKLKKEQNPLSVAVEKIKEICPAAVTRDGKIDFEELKTSLATDVAEDTIEKYEFTWVGKNAAKAEANRPIRKTLRPVVADSKDWDNTKNLYIEGDNLDALKLLQESYLGKVKMIYIDPPYNTGNDFVYCDNFKMGCAEFIEKSGQCDADGNRLFANTKTNGRFHSDWCSMMYPRLKIARNLLTDDGVIFVSIDDNEQANLKKICDEIFGEDNFVAQFAWNCATAGGIRPKFVSKTHEYVFVYAKQKDALPQFNVPLSPDAIRQYNKKDSKGVYREKDFLFRNPSNNINQKYGIMCPDGEIVYPREGYIYRFVKETFEQAVKDDLVVFKRTKTGPVRLEDGSPANWNIYVKKYLNEGMGCPSSLLPKDLISIYNVGTQCVQNLFDRKRVFENVKPTDLISYFLQIITNKDNIVLDFFSGSATTAHAVMQLNAEDGGNRRFIMVQLPEETDPKSEASKAGYTNICEIGKERIRRAGEKIKAEHPDKDLDIGFRVLRVDSDNMADIAKRPSDVTQGQLKLDVENIVPERSDLDLLFGVMVDCGLMLDMPIETKQMDDKTYYIVNHGDLVACFEKNIPEKLIYEIARMNPVCAVFRDSSFAEPKDKINLAEIFKNITGNDKCVKVL
ncbi:MAG: site-specific DNA-methyltransferase [Alphaproteobacteria bacterium]|nr:site-specific DNA-methyltransferase [Alphaproteobacteria bacterium]